MGSTKNPEISGKARVFSAVVALGLVSGRGKAGSFREVPTTWMFKFKDDLVWQVQIFSDTRHVLEALGEVA